jgi:glucose/arabinose dehydrogenase
LWLIALCMLAAPSTAVAAEYQIPPDNPFAATPGARPEIYAVGFRNPFRFSFDRTTGDLTLGDVGQDAREEIDFVPAGGASGGDFQWPCKEGTVDTPRTPSCPPLSNPIAPVFEYDHSAAGPEAITGGVVIRDPSMPSFVGRYVYADHYDLPIRTISLATPAASGDRAEAPGIGTTVAFGEDGMGGVYAVSLAGNVYKLGEDSGGAMTADLVTDDVTQPMNLSAPRGDPNRIFIVERAGDVLVRDGGTQSTFLDISPQVSTDGEEGMSSIAFAPDYATSGVFYVLYTDHSDFIRIDRFRRSATNPDVADPATQQHVLAIDHTSSLNHYGGQMAFGPDGYLYISTGDGALDNDEFDQFNNAQNLSTLLGKLLRIDPTPTAPVTPPSTPSSPGGPAPDKRAPTFFTKTKRSQRVLHLGGVVVYARCPGEGCKVTLTARLRVGKLSYPLTSVRKTLARGKRLRMKAKLTRRAKRALRNGMLGGAKLRVDVTLAARDAAGNPTRRHRATVRVRGG